MPAPAIPSGPTVTIGGVEVDPAGSPEGFDSTLRLKVINAIARDRALSARRRSNLDALLENSGQAMFPGLDANSKVDDIWNQISVGQRIGTLDTIRVPGGNIQLSDTTATFRPTGQGDVVQVNAASSTVRATSPPTHAASAMPARRSRPAR